MEYETQHQIDVLYTEEQINHKICELGEQISRDYAGKSIHLICILKGGACFMTELAKRITVPVSMDFMEGRDVLVVEDIIDSGRTLSNLLELLKERNAASIRLCTLLNKPERRVVDIDIDYNGFTIPDEFVVGFGLDYDQRYRNLPFIGIVRL